MKTQSRVAAPSKTHSLLWRDCVIYNFSLLALMAGSLKMGPEIWLNDYPPDIKARYGAISPKAKQQGYLLAIPFFLVTIGGAIWSTVRLKQQHGGTLPFHTAYLHTFAIVMSFWLTDLVLMDWLVFATWTPAIVVLPGTEGMAGYKDYGFHLRAHLRAAPALAIACAVLTLIAMAIPVGADKQ